MERERVEKRNISKRLALSIMDGKFNISKKYLKCQVNKRDRVEGTKKSTKVVHKNVSQG